jgi:hypothetical protein
MKIEIASTSPPSSQSPRNGVSDYFFQMGKSESRLFSLSDSRTFDLIASFSTSLAKASSSWIAKYLPVLGE